VRRILAVMMSSVFLAAVVEAAAPETGWPAYGGDEGGTRYSKLTQISPSNVGELRVAWIFRTGELGQGMKDWSRSAARCAGATAARAAMTCTTPMVCLAGCRCGWT